MDNDTPVKTKTGLYKKILALCLLLLIIGGIAVIILLAKRDLPLSPLENLKPDDTAALFRTDWDQPMQVYINGEVTQPDGWNRIPYYTIAGNGRDCYAEGLSSVFKITPKGAVQLSRFFTRINGCSDDGTVLYVYDDEGAIWQYDTAAGKRTRVTRKHNFMETPDATAISPDGHRFLFGYRDYRDDTWTVSGVKQWTDGKTTDLPNNGYLPRSVTDDGDLIYFTGADDRGVAVMVNGTFRVLDADIRLTSCLVNRNQTQFLFLGEGSTYLSVMGGAPIKISDGECAPAYPDYIVKQFDEEEHFLSAPIFCYVTFHDDFRGLLYSGDGKWFWLDEQANAAPVPISEPIVNCHASTDGKYYLVRTEKELYYLADGAAPLPLSQQVACETLTPDGSAAYWVDASGDLYVFSGNGISHLAENIGEITMCENGTLLAETVDAANTGHTLYRVREKDVTPVADGVRYLFVSGNKVAYIGHGGENENALWIADKDLSFTHVADNIREFRFCAYSDWLKDWS